VSSNLFMWVPLYSKESQNITTMESDIFVCTLFRVRHGQPLMATGWEVGFDALVP
jgi:hypothetical protein